MFKPFSSINSRRTCQDVIIILTQGRSQQNTGAGYGSAGVTQVVDSNSCDPLRSDPFEEKIYIPSFANTRKPGSRLGLKRTVVKTLEDEPPHKKERGTAPLPKGMRCFSVLYAKPQTKKNKTWEEDGFLTISECSMKLRNLQGEVVSSGRLVDQGLLMGSNFSVGGKIVEIQEELSELPAALSGWSH